MNILLVDIDQTKFPNFALKKLEKFHADKGDFVSWTGRYDDFDKIYVSCVFDYNKNKCKQWKTRNAMIGGSGYDLKKCLPLKVEKVKPRINLGFTTRGCIRNCSFCIVPEKEGKVKIVGDLLDLWDGKADEIIVMDNNILALPNHFYKVCKQSKEHNIRIDFNQGLDHRLLSKKIVKELKSINYKYDYYRFAFDSVNLLKSVQKAIQLLRDGGIPKGRWYVLVGYDSSPEEDLFRINYLRSKGQLVYIQRFVYRESNPFYTALAKWGNQPRIFRGMTWEQFINRPELQKHKKYIRDQKIITTRTRIVKNLN